MSVHVVNGDCREQLRLMDAQSVHCCVTSPPYFGLRDYGVDGQIGLEPTPDAFVAEMVGVFREVRRVLCDDGTLWINLGDSYAGGSKAGEKRPGSGRADGVVDDRGQRNRNGVGHVDSCKPKDLIGIPWRVAFALQADGWVLRQEIIWAKPNPMPESVRDRCTKAHEQVFLFAKAKWSGPTPGRFSHISDADARWLALLIDAEGSIVVKRVKHDGRGDTFAPQVSIGNTSEALMREVLRITGHGTLLERPGHNCRLLYWQVSNAVARDLLERVYPFLIVKQRQARIGIHVDDLTYHRGGQDQARKQRSERELVVLSSLWSRNKECNRFGQPDLSDIPEPVIGRWAGCERYAFDAEAIKEPASENTHARLPGNKRHAGAEEYERGDEKRRTKAGLVAYAERKRAAAGSGVKNNDSFDAAMAVMPAHRNKRSVWTVGSEPFSEAHFATFPPALIEPMILAGCPKGGTVLDPFGGAGTTGMVADRLGRNAVLIELNPAYADMARRRISGDAPLFAEVS